MDFLVSVSLEASEMESHQSLTHETGQNLQQSIFYYLDCIKRIISNKSTCLFQINYSLHCVTYLYSFLFISDIPKVQCPFGYQVVDNYCYMLTPKYGTVRQQMDFCFENGGYLATIKTSEANFVAGLFSYILSPINMMTYHL